MDRQTEHHIHELAKSLSPTILTIFGATGDLAMRYLLPTLVHMDVAGLLPATFRLVAVGRRDFTVEQYLRFFLKNAKNPESLHDFIDHFSQHVEYFRGDFENSKSFRSLSQQLQDKDISPSKHICYNRLYYFATAPSYFSYLTKILKQEGLLIGCGEHKRTIRVLVEKPFGHDLKSARALNKLLLQFFDEQQIYRIDHYLGKETIQNLMVMRFANDFLEPIWNSKYIDHVEISVLESGGVENRAPYYDKAGALKDMVQNHILQILALTAMDKPRSLSAESVRDEKVKILKALQLFVPKTVARYVVRGQYKKNSDIPGYLQEVGHRSNTETFVAMKAFVKLPRWKGVPFYLRTGKRLPRKVTEVSVHFKQQQFNLFDDRNRYPNILTFRVQPNEKVRLQINNKIPGFGIKLHGGSLEFGYKTAFNTEIPGAYERLLLDFMEGDQRLFIRSDEIEAAWKFIDSISRNWTKNNAPVYRYAAGSPGPKMADVLIKQDARDWWTR